MATKWAFTPFNLAALGVLEDFYEVYRSVEKIYDMEIESTYGKEDEWFSHRNEWKETERRMQELGQSWDSLTAQKVIPLCFNLINKHIYLFTDEHDIFLPDIKAFTHTFTFLDPPNSYNAYSYYAKYISFPDFLIRMECVATRTLYNLTKQSNSEITNREIREKTNLRIANKAIHSSRQLLLSADCKESPTNDILYLFDILSSTSCYKFKHPVTPAKYIVSRMDGTGLVALPVHYCTYCKKYFIGIQTLNVFEKDFGKFIVQKRNYYEDELGFIHFNSESVLHQLGYNVVDGNMTEDERRHLLTYLLEHKEISYFEMCSTIERDIRIFQYSDRHQKAVSKWKDDLRYIGEYVAKELDFNLR